ncbi:Adenine phosphoribosyltransferase [Tolypocladium ophioglossoides CBS 100239]|uniref:Adenine phosphoribosyltransferase n=1 Tax=Tolypocladium ophioglossoides (strain CBS 100239) TaxID=1163406 RepID=A0A0L0N2L7_TOLOC|nr:Adenine phosphoribosyltransferase [Tolypocladium ophioglossoides CBS 100239]
MATLKSLKWTLRQKATATTSPPTQPLSDSQYGAGFDILVRGSRWTTYQHFIIPQLSLLLAPLFNTRIRISALEVGPGPRSVLGYLPGCQRQKISRYAAFEPNDLFATKFEEWLRSTSDTGSPLPCLASPPNIHRSPFGLDSNTRIGASAGTSNGADNFDVIIFCHSIHGKKPKHRFIERALEMLVERPEGGIVVVFHRGETLHLDGLSCHRTASFPTGAIRVADDDEVLDCFARFVVGFVMQDVDADKAVQAEWRKVCRDVGRREEAHPDHLLFSSPTIMATFTQHATTLPELTSQVPLAGGDNRVKNREARLHHPASIIRPTEIRHVQQCVRWALNHGVGLTVVGGGHSGHCLRPNVLSVDMGAFDQVHILRAREGGGSGSDSGSFVVAEAGCQSGDIIRKTMAAGLTVPLGARPSVGAGLWLQGGIGHLARLHGLSCDAIVGAVVVGVASSQALYVGHVPSQHRPAGAVNPDNENDLLWAIKGAGTNFGIVISVTFKAYAAPTYSIRNWIIPLSDNLEARLRLSDFDRFVAGELSRNFSIDAYLYWDTDQLRLGVTMFETSTTGLTFTTPTLTPIGRILGPEDDSKTVDGVALFETEMYMSKMHNGHGGGKTSSFKRCLFLKSIGEVNVANILVAAVEARPSPLCYLHLLQGGGAVAEAAEEATAFGCRDWDFACVITGVWPRDQDGAEAARAAVQWVYDVARDLLPLSCGAYGADLGPDPRDAAMAVKAFGPNRPRLARLKHSFDPGNVLAYACPLPKARIAPKLIILVTGDSCAGKDYCANIWVSVFITCSHKRLKARAVSISDATKREYAAATGADLERLLWDRAYKEQHRPALSTYFQGQVQQRPQLPEEHFLKVVYEAVDVDVLLITGMRDEAPVAALSHLVRGSRLLEVSVRASKETRQVRRGGQGGGEDVDDNKDNKGNKVYKDNNNCPTFIFNNETTGDAAAKRFSERYLLPFFHEELQRLARMVRSVPNFPRLGIEFRHVLDISQQPGGLALCTSLLQNHFTGDWAKVNAVACCETGGFVYASALAAQVDVPLALIREAGKLPPPTISIIKSPSHISSSASNDSRETRLEMGRDVVPKGASVVVVDDVLATGKTLCAVLQLLDEAGIDSQDVNVIIVAEFPIHRGRELLRRHGFGGAKIQSLLVFDGA